MVIVPEDEENPFEDDIDTQVDTVLSRTPLELQKVNENLDFIDEISDEPLKSGEYTVPVFGFETVDISAILKKNIWNRSIFTVDKLCKMFLKMDLEQKKKYLKKKRPLEFNYIWLILLVIGIPIVILIILFILPRVTAML